VSFSLHTLKAPIVANVGCHGRDRSAARQFHIPDTSFDNIGCEKTYSSVFMNPTQHPLRFEGACVVLPMPSTPRSELNPHP
jgi:hypothetical protein